MLSEDTRSFLDFLTTPLPDHHRHAALQRFCRDLLDRPEEAKILLSEVASVKDGSDEDDGLVIDPLAALLDEARMARETAGAPARN